MEGRHSVGQRNRSDSGHVPGVGSAWSEARCGHGSEKVEVDTQQSQEEGLCRLVWLCASFMIFVT